MSPEDPDPATAPAPTVAAAPDLLVPAEPAAPEQSPGAEVPMPAGSLRIGRAPDNDLVVDDLIASRYHAELRRTTDGQYEIVDLGSHNGTYVNGRRISAQPLADSDTVGVGRSTFRLTDGRLRQFLDDGDVTVAAQDLVVTVAGGKVLLDRVSFAMPEKCLVGVIGPSGAGSRRCLAR
jgi:pSer/pThr/pTyr-binding forkhead associated (FHA) protein